MPPSWERRPPRTRGRVLLERGLAIASATLLVILGVLLIARP